MRVPDALASGRWVPDALESLPFTRRGYAVLAVATFGLVNAVLYGPRALNAVVAPVAVALGAAVWSVRRIERPDLERVAVEEGFVGETHTVDLRFSAPSSFAGTVHDDLGEGLAATGNELTATIGETTMTYDVTFVRRGVHDLGPTTVTARDVLGLAERTFEYDERAQVTVYPRVHDLTGRARHELNILPDLELVTDRGEFDALRDYERGDAMRDVDWKSSAKAPGDDLVVKEYVDEADLGEIRIAAETNVGGSDLAGEAARESADAMAEAAASLASFLLGAGLSVGVSAPDGAVAPEEAGDQRTAILRLLARTGAGRVPGGERAEADLVVRADGTDVSVHIDEETIPFERLTGHGVAPAGAEAPVAGG